MILTLIFIALIVAAIVVGVILNHIDCDDELYIALDVTSFLVGLVGTLICGIWCIAVNAPHYANTERYSIQETVKLYENEKSILLSFHTIHEGTSTELTSDITLETISTNQYYQRVNDYNTKIKDFKVTCMAHKNRRKDPWLSWFESSAWDIVTESYLDSLEYTQGK